MPSLISMPKPKEKERIMVPGLLGTPGKKRKKKKRRKPSPSLPETKHKSVGSAAERPVGARFAWNTGKKKEEKKKGENLPQV